MKQKKYLIGLSLIFVIVMIGVIFVYYPRNITPKNYENTYILAIRIMDENASSYTYLKQDEISSEEAKKIYDVLSKYKCHKAIKQYDYADETGMKYDIEIGEGKEGYSPTIYRVIVGKNNYRMDEGSFTNHQTIYHAENLQTELDAIIHK